MEMFFIFFKTILKNFSAEMDRSNTLNQLVDEKTYHVSFEHYFGQCQFEKNPPLDH